MAWGGDERDRVNTYPLFTLSPVITENAQGHANDETRWATFPPRCGILHDQPLAWAILWLHWLMPPILWAFSATRVRTTRDRAGGCRSFEAAFRRSCALSSAGRREISGYGKTTLQSRRVWEDEIIKAVAAFFIPIITPTAVKSPYCKFEFDAFLAREKELDRNNLIFPILYIPVPALTDGRWHRDQLLSIIGSRQYADWQNLRHLDASSIEVAQRIEKFCANICKALSQPWLSREERRQAETRRVAEGERRRQEKLQAEARQRAEAERRRYEAEKKRQLIAVDAASAPKSNVDQVLFAPGPVIGGFIAVAAAAVFLLLAY